MGAVPPESRWAARGGVLGRNATRLCLTTRAPCVLASHPLIAPRRRATSWNELLTEHVELVRIVGQIAVRRRPAVRVVVGVRAGQVGREGRDRAWTRELDATERVVVGFSLPAERVVVRGRAVLAALARLLGVDEKLGAKRRPVRAVLVLDPPDTPAHDGPGVVVPVAAERIPPGGKPAFALLALVRRRS